MAGQAQPDMMPALRFRFDNIVILEPGLSPSSVVPAGTPVTLRMDLGFDGLLAPLLDGDSFSVFNHIQNIETGANTTLPGGGFVVPAGPAKAHITVSSGPYTTGGPGSDFAIPAGFTSGTFRILTHVHANAPGITPIVAAFNDGLVLMVT